MSQIAQGRQPEQSWPNTRPEKVGDNWEDDVDNGTDYNKRGSLMKKSFADLVLGDDVLVQGMGQSDFLKEFAKSVGWMLEDREESIRKSLQEVRGQVDDFNKSLGGSLSETGSSLVELDGRLDALEKAAPEPFSTPSGREEYLLKSQLGDDAPTPKKTVEILIKGVEEGLIPDTEVIKYEAAHELSPRAEEFIRKSLSAGT